MIKINVTCEHESGEGLTQVEYELGADSSIRIQPNQDLIIIDRDDNEVSFQEHHWVGFAVEKSA